MYLILFWIFVVHLAIFRYGDTLKLAVPTSVRQQWGVQVHSFHDWVTGRPPPCNDVFQAGKGYYFLFWYSLDAWISARVWQVRRYCQRRFAAGDVAGESGEDDDGVNVVCVGGVCTVVQKPARRFTMDEVVKVER